MRGKNMIFDSKKANKNDMQNKWKNTRSQRDWVPRESKRMGHAKRPLLRASLSTDGHALSQERQPRTAEAEMGWILAWQLVKRGCQAGRQQRWPGFSRSSNSHAQPGLQPGLKNDSGEAAEASFSCWDHFWPPYNKSLLTEIISMCFYSSLESLTQEQ